MPHMMRMGLTLSLGSIATLLLVLPGSGPPHRAMHSPAADTVDADWPECPHSWQAIQVRDSAKPRSSAITISFAGGLTVPGPTTDIPEFHDCQRIIKNDGTYGPLMAVFAAKDLEERLFEAEHVTPATLMSYAAAEIVNHSADFSYAPLGIEPLFNCLYVFRLSGGPLRAKMVPVGPKEQDCGNAINPIAALGKELLVRETHKGIYDPSDIPPVARWDWDARHREHYIGLKCGNAWCEVGRPRDATKPDFVSSPPFINPGPAPIDGPRRVRGIKGWYDEQYLAVDDGIMAKPGIVIATIFPDPGLKSRDLDDYVGRWQPMSYVAMRGASALYKTKFNFDKIPPAVPLDKMNRISMCFGTVVGCDISIGSPVESGLLQSCGKKELFLSMIVPRWWAKLESATGAPKKRTIYKCVTRRVHTGTNIPATARWRWLADDETEWQYCPDGCCEVQAKFY